MPKVKKTAKVIHPNSRKALQVARQAHRDVRMDRRREEVNLKQKSKLKKLKWFKDNTDSSKTVYTIGETQQLIERYFERFDESETKLEEIKNMKGRHNSDRMSHEYKTKFAIEKEKQEYETSGFEVPNLCKQPSFDYFKNWDGDSRFLPAIDMVTISKSTKCK